MPGEPLSSPGAPTTSVLPSPDSAIELPKSSPASGFDDLMNCCSVQVVPARVNTYAAPEPPCTLAPTATRSPLAEIAIDSPKKSPALLFDALRYACCDHVVLV